MDFRKFIAWLRERGVPEKSLLGMTERTYKLHPLYSQFVESGFATEVEVRPAWMAKAKGVTEAPTGKDWEAKARAVVAQAPTGRAIAPAVGDTTSGELAAFRDWTGEFLPLDAINQITVSNYKSHFLYPRFLEAQKVEGLDVQTQQANLRLLEKQLAAEDDPIKKRILEVQLAQLEQQLAQSKADARQGSVESWYAKQQALSEGRQLEAQRFNEMLTVKGRAPKAVSPYEEEDRMARAFEAGRQSLLGELGGDRDWINRWKAQWAPNPFAPSAEAMARRPGEILEEQILDDKEGLTHWVNLANAMKANPSLGTGGFTYENALANARLYAGYLETDTAELARVSQKYEEGRAASLTPQGQADIIAGMREYQEGGRMTAPPTPEWLKEFVPGQTVGQTIKKIPLETPSGQQWTRTPLSVRQGLAGYADWTGQKFQDLLDRQAMMLPQDPRFGTRWTTARQTRV